MVVAVRASPLVSLPSSPFSASRNLKKRCNAIISLNIGLQSSHSKSSFITISSIKCSASSTSAIVSKVEEPLPLEVNEIKTMCKTWVWRSYNINYLSYQARNNSSRPSLLLVHGFGASVAHWRRNIATLAQNYTVYAIDLLGFGASDKPEGFAYNMETWAQLILDFVNEIIQRPTVLVGNSVGSLACVIAAADPSQTSIQGLVLLNCAGGMNNKAIVDDWRIKLLLPLLWLVDFLLNQKSVASAIFNRVKQRENLKNILLSVYGNKESVDEDLVDIIGTPADAEGALDAFVSIVTGPPGPSPVQLIPKITLPILVLWGDQDPFTPIDGPVGRYFSSLPSQKPNVSLFLLEGVGHCPHFSSSKVSGSNSNTPSTTTTTTTTTTTNANVHHNRRENPKAPSTTAVNSRKQEGSNYNRDKGNINQKNQQKQQQKQPRNSQQNVKPSSRRPTGVIPCGKRTDFGYDKDFEKRYTIGKLLGHGQFGYTYVATDKSSGDRVAVKRIEKNKMVLPIAVEDVKREVKILKALGGHENVVQFYNSFEDDNYVYIVMELCEGGELLDRILSKKDSRYTEKDAAIVVRQMLKVAAECHLHGLVHRDMKPENFLFKSSKEDSPLKATDFGLSDFIRPGKKFQDIVGSAYYVAPEVLKRRSGPESDVWSIGVITYILLCGRRPFWDKTEDGIFKEVLRNKPDFRRKPWSNISCSAKDFVKKLLVKDPRARLTAAQALSHPWVREGGNASEIPLDISVLSNMRQFVKYSRLKQFALRALASTLDEEEIADLRDQFSAIDVDKNGVISLEEMRQALAKDLPWKMKESRVLEILQAIDSNTDGLVDFPEFVAATLHVHQLEEHNSIKWQQRSQAAFEKFDVDRDGFITPEELKLHTGLRGSVDPLLEEADIDKDGKISISEFRRLLRTASMSSPTVRDSRGM